MQYHSPNAFQLYENVLVVLPFSDYYFFFLPFTHKKPHCVMTALLLYFYNYIINTFHICYFYIYFYI